MNSLIPIIDLVIIGNNEFINTVIMSSLLRIIDLGNLGMILAW